jgi:hypothetical protein
MRCNNNAWRASPTRRSTSNTCATSINAAGDIDTITSAVGTAVAFIPPS